MNENATVYALDTALARSAELAEDVGDVWASTPISHDPRKQAAQALCALSLQHADGVRALLPALPGSAITLVRPQLETLVRATWVQHAASGAHLARLLAPLSVESQQAAKKLPGVPEMLADLEKHGPPGAAAILGRARSRLNGGLNSYIHGGIHPFARQQSGYPVALLLDVLKNSNAMSMLTLAVLSALAQDGDVAVALSGLHHAFADVLPAIEPLPA